MANGQREPEDLMLLTILILFHEANWSASQVAKHINAERGVDVLTRSAVLGHVKRIRDTDNAQSHEDTSSGFGRDWVFNQNQKDRYNAECEDYLRQA